MDDSDTQPTIEFDDELETFLEDPELFQITDADRELLEEGSPAYKMEQYTEFQITIRYTTPRNRCGRVSIGGYYNDGTFYIESYTAKPEGRGYGTIGFRAFEQAMHAAGLDVEVVDIIDEAKDFWRKMGQY